MYRVSSSTATTVGNPALRKIANLKPIEEVTKNKYSKAKLKKVTTKNAVFNVIRRPERITQTFSMKIFADNAGAQNKNVIQPTREKFGIE